RGAGDARADCLRAALGRLCRGAHLAPEPEAHPAGSRPRRARDGGRRHRRAAHVDPLVRRRRSRARARRAARRGGPRARVRTGPVPEWFPRTRKNWPFPGPPLSPTLPGMTNLRTVHRVCPFCEATCGLAITVEGARIRTVRGDPDDPFSRGFLCPKAHGLKELHHDPDRLTKPVRGTTDGWQEISWGEAYQEIETRLKAIRDQYGNDAVGMYTGNPVVHDLGALVYRPVLARALASRSLFNSPAIDTLPKILSTGPMFGRHFPLPVPGADIHPTDHLLIIGANPAISHGSLMTMPDAPGRLKGVIQRGGKLVVVDPRRTETAKLASEHHFIRPGTDAAFLLALVHTLFDEDLVSLGS